MPLEVAGGVSGCIGRAREADAFCAGMDSDLQTVFAGSRVDRVEDALAPGDARRAGQLHLHEPWMAAQAVNLCHCHIGQMRVNGQGGAQPGTLGQPFLGVDVVHGADDRGGKIGLRRLGSVEYASRKQDTVVDFVLVEEVLLQECRVCVDGPAVFHGYIGAFDAHGIPPTQIARPAVTRGVTRPPGLRQPRLHTILVG